MASPCTNNPNEVIEKVILAKADADKFDKFVNGTKLETVQLGSGAATPTIRNVVAQMQATAAAAGIYETDLEIINVKDFGAVDASSEPYTSSVFAENSTAVQAAVNSAAANGGTVYIPRGVKYLRSEIDSKDVLIVDDSTGFRVTSQDWWWLPGPAGTIKAVMHRGLSACYPENTVLAFVAAAEAGVWGIETDICWTLDNEPVCCHDLTVDRTTDGTGRISEMTLAQIRELDAGAWVDEMFAGSKIPTLDEYLSVCRDYGAAAWIEIKTASNVSEEKLQGLIDKVYSYGLTTTAVVMAYDWSYLPIVRSYSSAIGVCLLPSADYSDTDRDRLRWLGGRVWWGPSLSRATQEAVKAMREAGVATYAWTATDGQYIQTAIKNGCHSVAMNNMLI